MRAIEFLVYFGILQAKAWASGQHFSWEGGRYFTNTSCAKLYNLPANNARLLLSAQGFVGAVPSPTPLGTTIGESYTQVCHIQPSIWKRTMCGLDWREWGWVNLTNHVSVLLSPISKFKMADGWGVNRRRCFCWDIWLYIWRNASLNSYKSNERGRRSIRGFG